MTSSGNLVTRVFTGRGELPLEGASVAIVRQGSDGRNQLVSIQATDRSGGTEPTRIDAPDLKNSQSPETSRPYSVVDIWVHHRGYQPLIIEHVQIFPGVTSVQELPLIPVPEFGGRGGETVTITPQDL